MVDPLGEVPPYLQLAEILRGQIRSGELPPRRPIPSELRLQQEYGLSRGTVRRAIAVLREEGMLHTVAHRGTYVSPRD